MILAALDFEFGFRGRSFDYTTAESVCGVIRFTDGNTITACPRRGMPWLLLEPYLRNPEIIFTMHHGPFAERQILKQVGLPWPKLWWDTELADRVLDIALRGDRRPKRNTDDKPYSLLSCLRKRGVQTRDSEAKKAMQEKVGRLEFTDTDLPDICSYCADDCRDTLQLARLQFDEFAQLPERLRRLYTQVLQPHLLRVADMTAKGILFDRGSFEFIRNNGDRLLMGMQAELKKLGFAGEFSHDREMLTAPPQNLNVIRTFENLGLHNMLGSLRVFKRDVDKPANQRRRSLSGFFDDGHKSGVPFIRAVKNYHDLIALLQTDWTEFIDSDGKIRPAVLFPGTSSYRTQQLKPNPLMLPYFARPLFHAAPGKALLELDFKSQEAGLAADFYGDEKMRHIYNTFELCMYCEIGAEMGLYPRQPGKPADPKEKPEQREEVKTALLAMQYGGQKNAIIQQTNATPERAAEILDAFERRFPELHEGKRIYLRLVKHKRFAENQMGLIRGYRPYTIKHGKPKDNDLSYTNYPIQSAGASVLMLALEELPGWTNPVLSMHDAILFEVEIAALQEVAREGERGMGTALKRMFPRLRCRCEKQAAFRYHKKRPDSLHEFCTRLGLELPAAVGWVPPQGFGLGYPPPSTYPAYPPTSPSYPPLSIIYSS